jgi:hypothetical protein
MRGGDEIAHDLLVAIRAFLGADKLRARNTGGATIARLSSSVPQESRAMRQGMLLRRNKAVSGGEHGSTEPIWIAATSPGVLREVMNEWQQIIVTK